MIMLHAFKRHVFNLFTWQLISWSRSYRVTLATWLGAIRCYLVGAGGNNFSNPRIGVVIGEIARPRECVCFGCLPGSKGKTGVLAAAPIDGIHELDSAAGTVGSDYKGGRVGYRNAGSTSIAGNR